MASSDIPSKLVNAEEIKNADTAQVLINAYHLDTSQSVPVVFKHERCHSYSSSLAVGHVQANAPPLSGYVRRARGESPLHLRLWHQHVLHSQGAGERGISKFDLDLNSLPEECRVYLGSKVTLLQAHLLACEEVHIQSVDAVTESADRSAIQFLEILSSSRWWRRNDTHYMFANKAFEQRSDIRLQGDPRVLKEGCKKMCDLSVIQLSLQSQCCN
uniref:Uncharacterized protein n=1 Tax=Ditylenchus dipsaci TaxID=166011 RepID=A0A915CSM9_9BILA